MTELRDRAMREQVAIGETAASTCADFSAQDEIPEADAAEEEFNE